MPRWGCASIPDTCSQAIKAWRIPSTGKGEIGFLAIVAALSEVGFDGYYVLEQDIMLAEEPPADGGPINNAKASFEALAALG